MKAWLAFFSCALWLLGCGGPSGTYSRPGGREPVPAATLNFLRQFPLLNDAGQTQAYTIPGKGISPFGAILLINPGKTAAFCSGTHVQHGLVVTSAHCMNQGGRTVIDTNPDHLFAVFYDKSGQKSFARISGGTYSHLRYRGFHMIHDIAVFRIDSADADRWDALQASLDPSGTRWAGGKTEMVDLWTYDPLASAHPALHAIHGDGMRFTKKTCTAATRPPKLWYIPDPTQPEVRKRIPLGASELYHLSLENCSTLPIQGNSGALMTLAGDPTTAVGLFAGYTEMPDRLKLDDAQFAYLGVDGNEALKTFPKDFPQARVLTVGYRFHLSLEAYLRREKVSITKPSDEADEASIISGQ